MLLKWLDVRLARIGLALALIAITTLALIPAPDVPISTGWDKTDHWSAFFTLSFLLSHSFPKKSLWWVAAVLVAYGIGIEVAQWFTPTRSADATDVVADSIGILGYAALYFFWSQAARRLGLAVRLKND
ncbi:MAG TPA: VanZ family protein [Spongiibacteraceae bacterium]|nr:VanZ family protein [Spongiibacteraceae bacterium]